MIKRIFIFLTALIFIAGISACKKRAYQIPPNINKSIRILWSDWAPAEFLRELCKDFSKQTGVEIILETVPFEKWQEVAFNELEKHGTKYDLIIGDSQWLGKGAVEGHYVDLSKWIREKGINKNISETAMAGYAEYPKGTGKYWAIPLQGDTMGFAYRKDKFEDLVEKENFFKKYNYPLSVPNTWEQLYNIAEFFYRPDINIYGIGIVTMPEYDGITMGFENVLFAWGGEWGNNQYKVKEYLNSPEAIDALKFYKKLYEFSPPKWEKAFWEDINHAMAEGKLVMAMNYFAFFPYLVDNKSNPYSESIGFFPMPKGPTGIRAASLGGMGISLISYSKKKEYALDFLQWLFKEDVQNKWSQLGGFTCHKNILLSPEFLNANPYNNAYMNSITMVKDFWVIPEYSELLRISQKYLYEYVVEQKYSAEETMNQMATEMEAIFEFAGYYKE